MIFSVVIPLYNKIDFVENTIQSALEQTYADFELLVIDDGSTDGSGDVVLSIPDPRIQYYKTEHTGVAATRNKGIQEATSKFVAFLDADDFWDTTFLAEIANAIREYPSKKIFTTGRTHIFSEVEIEYKNKLLPGPEKTGVLNHFQVIAKYLPALNMSSTVVCKRHILNSGAFTEGMQNHEDHEFLLRLAIDNEIVFINKPLSFYRKTGITSQSDNIFRATDFLTYLNTCEVVKNKISPTEQRWFQLYLNRFVLLSFIKYKQNYTAGEIKKLILIIDTQLSGLYKSAFKLIAIFPKANFYTFLKSLRRGG